MRYSVQEIAAKMEIALGPSIEASKLRANLSADALMQAGLSKGYSKLLPEMYRAQSRRQYWMD